MGEMTDKQRWELVQIAIDAFVARYPKECKKFFDEIKTTKTEYGLANDKELQLSAVRHTLSFPVVKNENGDDDCLLPIIERYLPNFTKSKYYNEFIKRYPNFCPAKKL